LTAAILKHYGADLELATVTFSVQNVMFSEDLQWNKGHLLRPDPNDSDRWNVIDSETSSVLGGLDRSFKFTKAALKTVSALQISGNKCVNYGGFIADHCSAAGCYKFTELGFGSGTLSRTSEVALCRELNYPAQDDPAINCMDQTTHSFLVEDLTCSSPAPTPSPTPTQNRRHAGQEYARTQPPPKSITVCGILDASRGKLRWGIVAILLARLLPLHLATAFYYGQDQRGVCGLVFRE